MASNMLIVEDDEDDQFFISVALRNLKNSGHDLDTVICADCSDALAQLEIASQTNQLPSLISVDINMPGRDGLELLSILRTSPVFQNIPIFVLTTSSDADVHRRAREKGAAGSFIKPEKISEMEKILKEMVRTAA